MQFGEEAQRLVGQDLLGAGQRRRRRHGPRPVEHVAHTRGFLRDHVAGGRAEAVAEGQARPFGARPVQVGERAARFPRCPARPRRSGSRDIRRR